MSEAAFTPKELRLLRQAKREALKELVEVIKAAHAKHSFMVEIAAVKIAAIDRLNEMTAMEEV